MVDNYLLRPNGVWAHRPRWKVIVNTVLRFVQKPFTSKPWLFVSMITMKNDKPSELHGYKFIRVQLND